MNAVLCIRHADAASGLEHWLEATEAAEWEKLHDVRRSFRSADVALRQEAVSWLRTIEGRPKGGRPKSAKSRAILCGGSRHGCRI